ncbi:MAG: hypothetical protein JST54_00145 [Deltaproteobacteria bacterium]|nr:hypothetical protein [Deltaproteobacteria bacterium]
MMPAALGTLRVLAASIARARRGRRRPVYLWRMRNAPGYAEGFLKRVVCHECGATKAKRSATAFVYCDYCASLTDWDFQIAISDSKSKLPGPAYEAAIARVSGALAEALARGDRAQYLELQREIFAAYVEACPASVPPRCGNPTYRAAFIEYSAEGATRTAFNPKARASAEALDAAVKKLKWEQTSTGTKVESKSFWFMFEALVATMESGKDEPELKHPDGAPLTLLRKMSMSMLAQGWIPYLTEHDTNLLLSTTGLASQYIQAPQVTLHATKCGQCGGALSIPEGAKRCLCESCGYVVTHAGGPVKCSTCAAAISVPEGTSTFACLFCKTELRAIRW